MGNQTNPNPAQTSKTFVTVSVAARYILGISARHVRFMCERGVFPGAFKPGEAHWRIPKDEVIAHRNRKVINVD